MTYHLYFDDDECEPLRETWSLNPPSCPRRWWRTRAISAPLSTRRHSSEIRSSSRTAARSNSDCSTYIGLELELELELEHVYGLLKRSGIRALGFELPLAGPVLQVMVDGERLCRLGGRLFDRVSYFERGCLTILLRDDAAHGKVSTLCTDIWPAFVQYAEVSDI